MTQKVSNVSSDWKEMSFMARMLAAQEVTVEDATGQNICRQGKRIRGVVGDFGQGVGNGYYVEKSMIELRNLTRQEWQTRLSGQMVSTGTELQVTSYEELRSFIQEELGELFEEDVQK